MYAIRSYYVSGFVIRALNWYSFPSPDFTDRPGMVIIRSSYRVQYPHKGDGRITSYNVCYTKLLRTTDLLSCVEIDPAGKPIAVIIWLHGIGADGYDFEPIVPQLRLPENLPVRFVFPHAPNREITLHGGIPSRAWFDILGNEWPRTLRITSYNVCYTKLLRIF